MSAVSYIFYSSPGGDPITLGDDAVGDHIHGGLPALDPLIEIIPIADSPYRALYDHGNQLVSLTWTVERDHQTLATAEQFKADHVNQFPATFGRCAGILQELLDDGNTRFLQGCSRPRVRCTRWDGRSTIFEYTIQGTHWSDTFNDL